MNTTTIERSPRTGIRTDSSRKEIGTAYVVTRSNDDQEQCSSLTPTQKTPRVQQHNPRRMKTSYSIVNSRRAFLQDNNKPAPTCITLNTQLTYNT
jgi:hypothetical protein